MIDTGAAHTTLPQVREVGMFSALVWIAAGWRDFRAHPASSLFYGACFMLMALFISIVFRHAYAYVSALVTGFFLVGPFLAMGLYDLSRRRERGEAADVARTFAAWEPNKAAIGMFAIVLAVVLMLWARASLVVFALFYTQGMPRLDDFLARVLSLDNLEFLFAYLCVGGFFATLVFAISVVSVPMMLDRRTDGVTAVLTSLRACAANVPAMLVWGAVIVVLVGLGFATYLVGLLVAVPVIGHATWHAYRALVD